MKTTLPVFLFAFLIFHFAFSEWLSSGEASFNVVPPFDLIAFAEKPTEQDNPPVA
jgi:hypothetical protein